MKSKPIEVGVTGGIGVGKSTICRIFQILSVPVYDADLRAKQLMTSDPVLMQGIKASFGQDAYLANGDLNRSFLAHQIFSNKEQIKKMNGLVHPAVGRDYEHWKNDHLSSAYIIREAALLFESGSFKNLDVIITITAPINERIKRVLLRDSHRTKEQIESIIKNQWPEEEKMRKSKFVIHNDNRQLIIPVVLQIHDFLMRKAVGK